MCPTQIWSRRIKKNTIQYLTSALCDLQMFWNNTMFTEQIRQQLVFPYTQ